MKNHNYNLPTGTDEQGPYWLDENNNKYRWNGPMVGLSMSMEFSVIEQEAQKRHPYEKHMGATWENGLHEGFIMGAEWMKEQILNQNK